uniref:Uncharacterized protein n=1 Tax=Micrurus lemniscatus lemniscatus TaxID=129467 RepID=A0A2D4JNH6_MICLE
MCNAGCDSGKNQPITKPYAFFFGSKPIDFRSIHSKYTVDCSFPLVLLTARRMSRILSMPLQHTESETPIAISLATCLEWLVLGNQKRKCESPAPSWVEMRIGAR